MTLRSDLLEVMREVESADPRSPLAVTRVGVQAFDFIAKRGKSIIAVMDTMDRLHRERYMQPESPTPPDPDHA